MHHQTHTHTHTHITLLQPFSPRAFISNSFPSISAINHSNLSTNAAFAAKDNEGGVGGDLGERSKEKEGLFN